METCTSHVHTFAVLLQHRTPTDKTLHFEEMLTVLNIILIHIWKYTWKQYRQREAWNTPTITQEHALPDAHAITHAARRLDNHTPITQKQHHITRLLLDFSRTRRILPDKRTETSRAVTLAGSKRKKMTKDLTFGSLMSAYNSVHYTFVSEFFVRAVSESEVCCSVAVNDGSHPPSKSHRESDVCLSVFIWSVWIPEEPSFDFHPATISHVLCPTGFDVEGCITMITSPKTK